MSPIFASIVVPKLVNGSITAVAIKSFVFFKYKLSEPSNFKSENVKSIPKLVVWPTSHLKSLLIGAGLYVE